MIPLLILALQDPLQEFLEKKNLKPEQVKFDLEYLATLPDAMVASHSHPSKENGKLALFLEMQKTPLAFPGRMEGIARRCAKSLPDLFATADEILGRSSARVDLEPQPAIEKIRAAMRSKDPATIAKVVLEVRGELQQDFKEEGLEIYVAGDQTHVFDKMASGVRVVIDLAGNDRYEGYVAAANGGVDMVFDFAGNDVYSSKQYGQAAAIQGTALLYDAAGDDKYEMDEAGQAFAREGVAALVDVAGNDTYEITDMGQAYGQWGGFAILIDLDGDDSYLGRDPLYGHPVTAPAPQDEKHNANMVQGAGQGYNGKPHRAGGVGILYDARGDDTYRSGCWSQGIGYFMGLGALIDLDGDDTYQSWVYVMGSGAHGGFGVQIDSKGDDVYTVGGWNGLGMGVDFGVGMFVDGAGRDRYSGSSNCFASSIGLSIALFQDGGGDDDYSASRNPKFGFGRFYEREDYNDDKQVTPQEKVHWAIFLDLGGVDRYPKGTKNVTRWDHAEYGGGLDRASPERIPIADWENLEPSAVLAELKKAGDLKAIAEFGFAHGFEKEASEALFKSGGKIDGCEYDSTLRLWIPPADREWAARLLDWRVKLAKAPTAELLAAKPLEGPKWVRRESRAIVDDLREARGKVLLDRVQKWAGTLKPLLDRRAALDDARAKDEKKLRSLWAARKQSPVKVDASAREAAKDLDRLEVRWRADVPLAVNLDEESLTLENLCLNEAERTALLRNREVEKANESAKDPVRSMIRELNATRAMFGRGALAIDGALAAAAEAGVREPKKPLKDRLTFEGPTVEATFKSRDGILGDKTLLDPKWSSVGASVSTGGQWHVVVGKRK